MQQIIGTISAEGAVTSGSNFSCSYDGSVYVIIFADNYFSATPVIIATVDTSANNITYTASVSVHNAGYTGFSLSVQNLNGENYKGGINLFVSASI